MDLGGKTELRPVHRNALAIAVAISATIATAPVVYTGVLFSLAAPLLNAQGASPAPPAPAVEDILGKAEKDFEEGRLEAALARCRRAIELESSSAYAYFLLGMIQKERGAKEEAAQALQQSVKLDPSRIASHVYLARLYFEGKKWLPAENEFQAAIRLDDATGAASFGLALALLAEKRYTAALPHLVAAVDADTKDPERLFTLAATQVQLKHLIDARRNMSRLEGLAWKDPWVFFRLGTLLQEHGMLKEADTKFERVATLLEETKDNPPPALKLSDVYLKMARLRFDRQDYFSTLACLEKIEPGTLDAVSQATALDIEGAALLAVGRAPESQKKLRLAAEAKPDDPDVAFLSIWADVLAGDMKAAIATANAARDKWPQVPSIPRMLAIVERERAPERIRVPFSEDWHLKGEGMVCCPCKVPCPCRSNGPPTYKHCENTGVFRITEGHYGNVPLDGFVFARMGHQMGPDIDPAYLYVRQPASDDQVIALERIIQSFNPLRPLTLLNVKRTEISFGKLPKDQTYEVKIPGVLEIKIQRQLDAKGEPLMSTAALDYFSNTLEYARNLTYKAWGPDGRLRWDYSGRQANYRGIDLDSRDYHERKMLIQFADGSGFFNDKQLELIKGLKLPTLRNYPKPGK
jgi:Flp pilus assembly protein TadD